MDPPPPSGNARVLKAPVTEGSALGKDDIRGERIVFSGPNTNTNIIRVHKFDRIRIRILFVFFIMTEYEYEYYSGSEI